MNPPIVYEVTKPSSQRTTKMTAIVWSVPLILLPCADSRPRRRRVLRNESTAKLAPTRERHRSLAHKATSTPSITMGVTS